MVRGTMYQVPGTRYLLRKRRSRVSPPSFGSFRFRVGVGVRVGIMVVISSWLLLIIGIGFDLYIRPISH